MRGGLLFLLVMCLTLNGFSGHLVGGEISYTQIGTDSYLIELRMYRDCYASFPLCKDLTNGSTYPFMMPRIIV